MSVIDFNRCSEMALAVTRKVVNEFELDQRGLDEITVFNVVLRSIVDYENTHEKTLPDPPTEPIHTSGDEMEAERDWMTEQARVNERRTLESVYGKQD